MKLASKKLKARQAELESRTQLIKEDLGAKSASGRRVRRIAIYAVIAGVATLGLYLIFRSFMSEAPKDSKPQEETEGWWDELIKSGVSRIGEWVVKQIKS